MTSYRLKDEGYPFKKIYHGKKWVGRVGRHADGGYFGTIGKDYFYRAPTEIEAFELVVARRLGYKTAAALRSRNAEVRADNRARRAAGRDAAKRFLAGDLRTKMAVLDELFEPIERAAKKEEKR